MRQTISPVLHSTRTIRAMVNGRMRRVGRIRADWHGGAYVDLTFTDSLTGHIPSQPIEVINVWDYETGAASVPFTQPNLAAVLAGWIADMDADWPDWFSGYLENSRY